MNMLEIKDLYVDYGSISALKGICLHVDKGELVTLIGSNGAGKTSTLMAVSGLAPVTGGSIRFEGKETVGMAPDKIVRLGISHIPEGRKIFPGVSVYENLIAGSFGKPGRPKEKVQELVERQYERFPRLGERSGQLGGSLSGGEQQMLAIARGLMMEPDLLMLDEPSLGLAPIVVEEIFELLAEIKKDGATILLIEQNASMALSIADRGYVLALGEVTLEGKGKDLLEDPMVIAAYLGG